MRMTETFEELEAYQNYYLKLMRDDVKENAGIEEPYPWDTFEMATKIQEVMSKTNWDHGFNQHFDVTKYIAVKMKHCKNKKAIELLRNFYRYNEYNYNAELYGHKIIDWCSESGMSYPYAIFSMVQDNDDFEEGFNEPFVQGYCYMKGSRMKGCSLDKDGNIVYKPFEPFVDITPEEFYKKIDKEYGLIDGKLPSNE